MRVTYALLRETIEGWRLDVFGTVATQIEFQVLTDNPKDVRFLDAIRIVRVGRRGQQ